jgi:hypothetical protein
MLGQTFKVINRAIMSQITDPPANSKQVVARSNRWQYLGRFIGFGISVVGVITGISLGIAAGRFEYAFGPEAAPFAPYPQMSFILLVVIFLLISSWYLACHGELVMLRSYCEEFIPILPNVKFQILALAGLLGTLAYFSNRPVVFAAVFAFFKLVEIWLLWVRDKKIRDGLTDARKAITPGSSRLSDLSTIERYYLDRPQIPLGISILCATIVALVLAVYGEFGTNGRLYFSLAYAILIVSIVTNEVIFIMWRRVRDKKLGERFY